MSEVPKGYEKYDIFFRGRDCVSKKLIDSLEKKPKEDLIKEVLFLLCKNHDDYEIIKEYEDEISELKSILFMIENFQGNFFI